MMTTAIMSMVIVAQIVCVLVGMAIAAVLVSLAAIEDLPTFTRILKVRLRLRSRCNEYYSTSRTFSGG